jgi:hypothetical protein
VATDYHPVYLSIGLNNRKPVRVGLEYSRVHLPRTGEKYLDRFFAYVGGTFRLHRFWRGDDDRAPHDHPWWFVTFPFVSYVERYWDRDVFADGTTGFWYETSRVVKAWRFHFRPAKFRHIVVGRADGKKKPFWTLVITGFASNAWGFYPKPDEFIPWREWD